MVIAIDGPAGAGKSTVCRLLAEKLGYTYLDTGAMYRAVAWALMRENIDLELESPIAERLPKLPLRFSLESGALSVSYNGSNLREELRRPEMARKSSRVSRFGCVREFLTIRQRKLATEGDIVAEGRDMTTVVFPDAPVKVFLTADLSTRTRRRRAEYLEKGIEFDFETLEAQLRERDEADRGRSLAPLRPAPDAQIVDTSDLGIPEVVDLLLKLVREKRPRVDCADSHKN